MPFLKLMERYFGLKKRGEVIANDGPIWDLDPDPQNMNIFWSWIMQRR